MIKSIKTIDITEEFVDNYCKLLNQFRISNFSKKNLLEFIDNLPANQTIFIMFDSNNLNLIGTVTVILEKKLINNGATVCHIEDLIIENKYKSKGLGSKLIKFIIDYSKKENCYKIILNCSDDLKKFYEKNDFICKNNQMSFYLN